MYAKGGSRAARASPLPFPPISVPRSGGEFSRDRLGCPMVARATRAPSSRCLDGAGQDGGARGPPHSNSSCTQGS